MANGKKVILPLTTAYVAGWRNGIGRYRQLLSNDDRAFPMMVAERIVNNWQRPDHHKRSILSTKMMLDILEVQSLKWYHSFLKDIGTPLKEKYGKTNTEVFLREIGFATAVYFQLSYIPKREEIERDVKSLKKRLKKSLDQFDALAKSLMSKPTFPYIVSLVDDSIKRESMQTMPPSFSKIIGDLSLLKLSLRHYEKTGDNLLKQYSARDRATETRNGLISALIESYRLCFGSEPTSTDGGSAANFMNIASHLNDNVIYDSLDGDSLRNLVKKLLKLNRNKATPKSS